jgi:aldose 1-epimerase
MSRTERLPAPRYAAPMEISGAPVLTLERPAPGNPDQPAFLSAQVLPGRGLMTLQIRAHVPGRGATDLLAAPPLERAREILDGEAGEYKGNPSYYFGAAVLLPFANRIRGALTPDGKSIEAPILGRTLRLPANAGGRKAGAERCAMHGLLLASRVEDVRRETTGDEDTLRATFPAGGFGGHWPSSTELSFEIGLRSDSFTFSVTARNVGSEVLPMAIGWHPYFALPSGRRAQARLHVPARRRLLVIDYDEVIPTGEVAPVAGTPYDFSMPGGRPLGDLFLDECFVDLERTDEGLVVAGIADPEAGYGVRVVTDAPDLRAVQVYAPPDAGFIALEPQYNWIDPFGAEWEEGTDTGMALLAPGAETRYAVRLEVFGA